jgi:hypothetical protein
VAPGTEILVSTPCHLKPYVRFSLIRLSDNPRLTAFRGSHRICLPGPPQWNQQRRAENTFRPPSIACAAALVMYTAGVIGPRGHAPSLTSPLGMVEAEVLYHNS